MSQDAPKGRRFEPPQPGLLSEDLLEEIDALALELAGVADAAASGRVPISARADYLRALAAHRRALRAWTAASRPQQLNDVRDALEQSRDALEAMRARLRR